MPPNTKLQRIQITQVRNLRRVKLDELGSVNVFFGANGSGKTSVLEAVHLLGMARSFRGTTRSLITHGEKSCTVFGEIQPAGISIGVNRSTDGTAQLKLAGESVRTVSALATNLPLQVIAADSFDLLTGSPGRRRQFLDWGVFHVEHTFFPAWQRYQRALKQRNILLRRGKLTDSQLAVWDREICESGEVLTGCRERYFDVFVPLFLNCLEKIAPMLMGMELRLRHGWERGLSLREALVKCKQADVEQGYTHVGPQRADISVLIDGRPAAEVLSRGQQKLVICSMKLAQGQLFSQTGEVNCTYLIDDLPSELDRNHANLVCESLAGMVNTQIFISCVEANDIIRIQPERWKQKLKMFHVEQGHVVPSV